MGGFGSGMRTERPCTDELFKLDIRSPELLKALRSGAQGDCTWNRQDGPTQLSIHAKGDYAVFNLRKWFGVDVEAEAYHVPLETTACHFGGERLWFRCPNTRCNRRAAVLYGGKVFLCRLCWDASYRCQRETSNDRLFRRIYKLRALMGWAGGCADGPGPRPKAMSHRRYAQLCAAHEVLSEEIERRAILMVGGC